MVGSMKREVNVQREVVDPGKMMREIVREEMERRRAKAERRERKRRNSEKEKKSSMSTIVEAGE